MPMYILIPPKQDEEKQKCFLPFRGIREQVNSAWQDAMIFPR